MKCAVPLFLFALCGCANETTHIPPPPVYVLALPEKQATWVEHLEKGFLAGCEQLQMDCKAVRYKGGGAEPIAAAVLDQGDTKGAPPSIAFESPELIKQVTDSLSLKGAQAILVGADDSSAYRLGHVGPDAKRLATLVARRSQTLDPPARRILYVLGSGPVDLNMLEASVFRESDQWRKYRPRLKPLTEVTDADFQWCDLVVPIGEDAQSKAIASSVTRIFPTEPNDSSLELLKSGRAAFVIANNYFDIGLRASRIAREQAVYGRIARPILPIAPKEIDSTSLQLYMETRFRVPEIAIQRPPAEPELKR